MDDGKVPSPPVTPRVCPFTSTPNEMWKLTANAALRRPKRKKNCTRRLLDSKIVEEIPAGSLKLLQNNVYGNSCVIAGCRAPTESFAYVWVWVCGGEREGGGGEKERDRRCLCKRICIRKRQRLEFVTRNRIICVLQESKGAPPN